MSWYELAAVVLVDRAGRILLQLRDSAAPNWPDQWGLPGGHVEPGETVIEAAHRELWEETGLRASLTPYVSQDLSDPERRKHYLIGATDAAQADVVLGEGAAMVFLPPAEVLDGRPLTPGTREVLATFFSSAAYTALASP